MAKQIDLVTKALHLFDGSFINANNELILNDKFNIYIILNDVNSDFDFMVKLCEWFSRDCSCALRYKSQSRLLKYYDDNIKKFNELCGTNFTLGEMDLIYCKLGGGIHRQLTKQFVKSGFDLSLLEEGCAVDD